MDACPSDSTLRAYLLGDLPAPSLEAVAQHVEACPACDAQVLRLDGLTDPLLTALRASGPSNLLAEQERPVVRGYEILERLGRGGSGTVYRALHVALNRVVALKMIHGGAHAGAEELGRFRNEAAALAALQHPNLVQTYEIGQQDGALFLALELVEGGNLSTRVAGKPLPPRQCAELAETLARAIHHAHLRGIVHRDLKPANVLIGIEPGASPAGLPARFVPKITDFGLAKQLGPELHLTQTGGLMGTPAYMAPEQTVGARAAYGPAIDVYGLGATLYQMLTGRVPFEGGTAIETLALVREAEPAPPRLLQPGVPRDLQTICLKCLEKDPHRRYPTALALADDLRRFLDREPIRARPASPWERAWKRARRHPVVTALAASLLVAVALGVAGVLSQWRSAVHERRRAEAGERLAIAARDVAETNLYFSRIAQARLEWLLNDNAAGARDLLDQCRPRPGQTDRRGWEWHYLERLRQGSLLSLEAGPSDSVLGVAFSPDGRSLATAGRTGDLGAIALWDPITGAPRGRLAGHTRTVVGLAFRPDGRVLASLGLDQTIRLWDLEHARPLRTLDNPASVARSVAFSPDGNTLLAGGPDRAVTLWDALSGKPLTQLVGHRFPVRCVAFSPDGRLAASGCRDGERGELIVWDIPARRVIQHHQRVPGHVDSVAFSPDGRTLAAAAGRAVLLVDVASGRVERTLIGHEGNVKGVAFRPDGVQVATVSADRTARLWSVRDGEEDSVFRGHTSRPSCVTFHPGARLLATGDEGGSIKVWDATAHPEYRQIDSQDRFPSHSAALAFDRSGKDLVALQRDGRLKRIDVDTGAVRTEHVLDVTPRWLTPATLATFSGDGRLAATVSGDDAGVVSLWDPSAGKRAGTLGGSDAPASVTQLAFSYDGRRLATGAAVFGTHNTREIQVWDTTAKRLEFRQRIPGPDARRLCGPLALSPDGNRLAFESDVHEAGAPHVVVVDLHAGVREVTALSGHSTFLLSLEFSPDSQYLAGGDDAETVIVWSLATARPVHARPLHALAYRLAFHPDGRRLTAVNRDQVHIWDVPTGQEVLILRGAPPPRSSVGFNPQIAWSPDGLRLAAGMWNRSISIWDATEPDAAGARASAQSRAFGWHLRQASAALIDNAADAFAFHWRYVRDADPPDRPSARWRGLLRACQGNWQGAADEYGRALPEPLDDPRDACHLACLQALASDRPACRETCRTLARRFVSVPSAPAPDRDVIRTLALLGDPAPMIPLARLRTSGTSPADWLDWHILGLAQFRAGAYADALRSCRRSLAMEPTADARSLNDLVLALAETRLGHAAESQRWRTQAHEWLQRMTRGESDRARLLLQLDPLDGMEFLILHAEALLQNPLPAGEGGRAAAG